MGEVSKSGSEDSSEANIILSPRSGRGSARLARIEIRASPPVPSLLGMQPTLLEKLIHSSHAERDPTLFTQ